MRSKFLRNLLAAPLALSLGGCHLVLLHSAGAVAARQSGLMIASVFLMLLIIVPVLIAIAVIAWRYRASANPPDYDPDWEHSSTLELLVWAAPLMIIIALGAMTWIGTHQLDPYRPVDHADYPRSVIANVKPLRIDVVSLEWKWLFLYPDYGIATVNQVAAPVGVPIRFHLTAATMMDSFFVPAIAGQIYTMPGMQTVLHAVVDRPGSYRGFSANYSGSGFTDMRFRMLGMSAGDFARWVAQVKAAGGDLNRETYARLALPSRAEPVHYYAMFSPDLYSRILDRCVQPGETCMSRMMARDAGRATPAGRHPAGRHGRTETNL